MNREGYPWGILLLLGLMLLLVAQGCIGVDDTRRGGNWFEPFLPPHDVWEYGIVHTTSLAGEHSEVTIPGIQVNWAEVGRLSTETILVPGQILTTHKAEIAEWEGGKFRITQYAPNTYLSGCIRLTRDVSLIGLFGEAPEGGQVDVSKLDICYTGEGSIGFVRYTEQWGISKRRPLALGGVAYWYGESLKALQAEKWWRWGFWEKESPLLQHHDIIAALNWWGGSQAPAPTAMVMDIDAPPQELIGRQPGAKIVGQVNGWIDLEYRDFWGCQPNVPRFGAGSLTRVIINSGSETYTIWVLSSRLSPQCTTWYLFFRGDVPLPNVSPEEALVHGQSLSPFLKVYATGGGEVIRRTVKTPDGWGIINLGETASIYYSIAAPATISDLKEALRAIDIMGPAAQKAIGWGFAESVGAGNGLRYFLSTVLVEQLASTNPHSPYLSPALIDQPGIVFWPPEW